MLIVLRSEALSLVVAGALLSITLNPFLFRAVDGTQAWPSRRDLKSSLAGRASDSAGRSR